MPSKKPEGFKFSKAVLIDKETGLPVAPEDVEQFASEPRELTSLTNQVVRALPRDEVTTPFPIPKTPIPRPRTEQSVFYEQALDDEIAEENLREIEGDEPLALNSELLVEDPEKIRRDKLLGLDPDTRLGKIEGDEPLETKK
jgi:hypothetical protein